MIGDLSFVIRALSRDDSLCTVIRRSPATIVDGYSQPGPTTEIENVKLQILPAPRSRQKRDRGEGTNESITILSPSFQLFTSDTSSGGVADRVVWRGRTYEIASVKDWKHTANYRRYTAVRVGP